MDNKRLLSNMLSALQLSAENKNKFIKYLNNLDRSNTELRNIINNIVKESEKLVLLNEDDEITVVISRVNEVINILKSLKSWQDQTEESELQE